MELDQLRLYLESFEEARLFLSGWGLRDLGQGWRNFQGLARILGPNRLAELCVPLSRYLPRCPDPDMGLNNLERFLAAPTAVESLLGMPEGRSRTLEILLQLLSTSHYFSDLLAAHPEYLPMLRIPLRRSPSREELIAQLQAEVDACFEDSAVLARFRSFRERQILRIGANDIYRDRPLEEITQDISQVADAALEVALRTALRQLVNRFGEPATEVGPGRCCILAFGKLGGEELNYSSDIDLMMIYNEEGVTRGRLPISLDEFYGRAMTEVVRLLSTHPQAYRIDLRLRPEGDRGSLARSVASTLSYYDTLGRTWERQALIKLRPVAGDLELGREFLRRIEPYVYRKYLSFAEINEIKALKRKIERKTTRAGEDEVEVKTGRGGIRDVEFTIQFLQLLNGGDLPEVRQRNTLQAIHALADAECLTVDESQVLESTYRFLRKVEHRLQLMFDLQTHRLPEHPEELARLARRMGYKPRSIVVRSLASAGTGSSDSPVSAVVSIDKAANDPLEQFLRDYREKTRANREILNHLLHDTFRGDSEAEPEADLILAPDPDPETIRQVLGRYRFRDVEAAFHNLMQLATESVPFLPGRRCRQFLASIAPSLLQALSETPDPDMALTNLEKVTASLGAKGVLWELFSFNPPSLRLYVDLCAWSQFLSELLIKNPGMIDELVDSLVLNRPRSLAEMREELAMLCHNAEDTDLILHSFREKELLRIGVNDILGKDELRTTLTALSDLAEAILGQIAEMEWKANTQRFGRPILDHGPRAGEECRWVLLGLGKLGGRELTYNSDLDLILIYEGDGRTNGQHGSAGRPETTPTDNFHFFSQLAQRIINTSGRLGPRGRLYQVDMRLRPTGRSGSLVTPLSEFRRYYSEGTAQLWERQALTRARVVHGDPEFGSAVLGLIWEEICSPPWNPQFVDEFLTMRRRLELSRGERNLKRGLGGIVDIEFLVQFMQLKFGPRFPEIRRANVWDALNALQQVGLIHDSEYLDLRSNYEYLRWVESRLRIVSNTATDELPENEEELIKIARRLGYDGQGGQAAASRFLSDLERRTARNRELFLAILNRERDRDPQAFTPSRPRVAPGSVPFDPDGTATESAEPDREESAPPDGSALPDLGDNGSHT
jgi:glutamate-ammonia-ligase adenylyltransferase